MERIDKQIGVARGAPDDTVDEVDLIPVRTYWQLVRQRFAQHRLAVIALVLMIALIALAVIVPALTGDQYQKTSLTQTMLPASLAHPLGTNQIGQDMFLRLMKALQTSLFIGFMAVLIIATVGVTLGAIAGYYGGWIDNILMRLTDLVLTLPGLAVLLTAAAFLGNGSQYRVAVILALLFWTGLARIVRGSFLSLREKEYVEAAKAVGSGDTRIMLRHILPNVVGPIVVNATLIVGIAILTEAALSFLGFGIQPPTPALGKLISDGQELQDVAWWLVTFPGLTIVLIVLCINFIGDGLRDALDPTQRRTRA